MADDRCDICGGTGRCNFVAHSKGPDEGCLECEGTMRCRACRGTGRR